jgi:basic membrane protein A
MNAGCKTILICMLSLLLQNCSEDTFCISLESVLQANITLLVTPNGLGDNGYDDDAAKGVFAFMEESGVPVHLMMPEDVVEGEEMYLQWLSENATRDSSVLIVGSPAYIDVLKRTPPKLSGRGSRVMLFESDEQIEGVSTVMINRYGVSYLAGAMSNEFDAFILAAAPGYTTLEDAIAGFKYGHQSIGDGSRTVTLQYLADGEEGFAMPDSAYRTMCRRAEQYWYYDEMIFPLLGGSEAGVIKYLNSDDLNPALLIGMDVEQTGQSPRIPFSVVIRIGEVIKKNLVNWIKGQEWPSTQKYGLADGLADIVITPNFSEHINIWDERYEDDDAFLRLYNAYYESAIRIEEEYENK